LRRLIVIGTRGSRLALWQANNLKDQLKALKLEVELRIIKTKGDVIQHVGFDKMEGKGFFTKEIEDALLDNSIDIAVHSLKDLPTGKIPGLTIGGLSDREDPADLLIINKSSYREEQLLGLKDGAVIGTSSIRRKCQILNILKDVQVEDLRGNVPTRIGKLEAGQYDAILLAAAGVNRLQIPLDAFHVVRLHPREFVPAPGQGIVAYQCREGDKDIRKILQKVHHKSIAERSNVERKVMSLMDGGCQVPLGVYCEKDAQQFFHVYAAWQKSAVHELRHIQLSQSTTLNLAERVVEKLLH
jgi:hydroxymethylbilane synthase